jgi:hypothetical protein
MKREPKVPTHFSAIAFEAERHVGDKTTGFYRSRAKVTYCADVSNAQAMNVQSAFNDALAEVCVKHGLTAANGFVTGVNKALSSSGSKIRSETTTVSLYIQIYKNGTMVDAMAPAQKNFLDDLGQNLKRRLGPPSARKDPTP